MRKPFNILVWQWGRRGAGPKIAAEFSKAVASISNVKVFLSLSNQAEIVVKDRNIQVDLPVKTYSSILGYIYRVVQAPLTVLSLYFHIKKFKVDVAICTMPGPMDLIMSIVLSLLKIPHIVIVHDVYPHPGDGYIFQHFLQKLLMKRSKFVVTFSEYVYKQLLVTNLISVSNIIKGWHPPFAYSAKSKIQQSLGKEVKLLNFGRLLLYKGLDILEESLDQISSKQPYKLRIVGHGPQNNTLDQLNKRNNVSVENRWVPEDEIAELMEWADVVILPYREASQSGIAATALAFGKPILVTNVGGLVEQFDQEELVFICEPTVAGIAEGLDQILELKFPLHRIKHDADQEWKRLAEHLVKEVKNKLYKQ